MIAASRRCFITGLVALVAAPVIVRAGSLMQVNSKLIPGDTYLSLQQITREAVQLFKDSNAFSEQMNDELRRDFMFMEGEQWTKAELERSSGRQYDNMFAADGAKIGDVLRIRLPNDFVMSDGPGLTGLEIAQGVAYRYVKARRTLEPVPQVPDGLALAVAAVAVAPVMLAKPVTRRFWAR